jgi:hypothetical protein
VCTPSEGCNIAQQSVVVHTDLWTECTSDLALLMVSVGVIIVGVDY